MKKTAGSTFRTLWKGWGYSFVIGVIIATTFKSAIADWYIIPTGSMKPTIVEGDRVFVNKLAYDVKLPYTTYHLTRWRNPQRGEIVVFYSPADGTRLIKRVIGIPGDSIAMRHNRLIINGMEIQYEPVIKPEAPLAVKPTAPHLTLLENLTEVRHPIMLTPHLPSPRSFGPIIIPEGEFFMLGDNRDNSGDSRFFGFVRRELILGKATAVVASFDINSRYRPRWNRFFTKLM